MELEQFIDKSIHLINFNSEQLDELLDFQGIEDIDENKRTSDYLRLLGQFLVGNKQGTAEEIKNDFKNYADELCKTWVNVIADKDTLRAIAVYFSHMIC